MKSLSEESRLKIWMPQSLSGAEFLSDTGASVYRSHVHDAYTLDLVIAGRIEYCIGSHRIIARAGEMIWIDRCEVHGGLAIGPEMLVIRSILIDGSLLDGLPRFCHESRRISDPFLFREACLLHLQSERQTNIPDLKSCFTRLVLQLFAPSRKPSILQKPEEHETVLEVKRYITSNFQEPISIRKIAKLSGLSTPHLVRAFRQAVGLPPYAYLTQLRIARARLLLSTGMAPADVAAAVGFSDQSHLTRFFKRTTGMTPASYLRSAARAECAPSP